LLVKEDFTDPGQVFFEEKDDLVQIIVFQAVCRSAVELLLLLADDHLDAVC
jgi:hypothetical protein